MRGRRNTAESFWARVEMASGLPSGGKSAGKKDSCWQWQGQRDRRGYGRVGWQGKKVAVHRLAYQLIFGWDSIPERFHLHHRCKTANCVNPAHLQPLSASDHHRLERSQHPHKRILERYACLRRHPRSELAYQPSGKRYCKMCRRANRIRRWRALKAHPEKLAAQRVAKRAYYHRRQRLKQQGQEQHHTEPPSTSAKGQCLITLGSGADAKQG